MAKAKEKNGTTPTVDENPTHKVNPNKVKAGDMMAFVYFVKVEKVKNNCNQLTVKDLDNSMNFDVEGAALIERSYSADQFEEEIKVTKTKAAEILISSHNRPVTVCFEKADGEERTLRGRLVAPEPLLGRSRMEDLDITGTNKLRLVDHRTIKSIIVDGVKYTVKP